ncbi:2-oxo-4-hydroxy-4-carboxy-5-ureidoimidazoline decarboxylase [Streptomyces pluripotens]|uniref:2-oxo-4-hydroxy-4-carboxy-5-ureidoimidazoline decarboxylase n=1 Tax=Streptomyces pluripotens TaxID=1355015 RepID=A0A221P1S1_9ACTN|nr:MULTISPECIES: 2-oxo-4-hydroxy-4-carboxy-5-ureidoimidazoline decarboxylase [Streptomyces]ARP71934.1 2-oxo-4-hydroxy-4-carboxy-5-ureidoimidazoline decarboxylase [Streptomyces pluripotens]ASN26181.1 2-oxo-4-hydroxy-4-carboxy-5-ureidoimidazoline decarboxylase [Streptomyces pluripotens]KIE26352.1 OHCU decarboxylase [Streptomyces sp. MUSC 125]MCH0556429.1 2-oxo-4-hydroxy-4-carboxy-5-ureidoimidazoline decarboxylase [Streptomyces sp. MUM 16J]
MTRGPTLPAHHLPYLPKPLDAFNAAPAEEARTLLLHCLRSLRWSCRLVDHRPYPDLDALLAAADEAAYDLSPGDLTEALAGESLTDLPEGIYSAAHMALSAAHAAYEARFGHAFVIYLGDVHPDEVIDCILEGIRSRLTNDPEEERVTAAEEVRRLARQRLGHLLRGAGPRPPAVSPHSASSRNASAHGT